MSQNWFISGVSKGSSFDKSVGPDEMAFLKKMLTFVVTIAVN